VHVGADRDGLHDRVSFDHHVVANVQREERDRALVLLVWWSQHDVLMNDRVSTERNVGEVATQYCMVDGMVAHELVYQYRSSSSRNLSRSR